MTPILSKNLRTSSWPGQALFERLHLPLPVDNILRPRLSFFSMINTDAPGLSLSVSAAKASPAAPPPIMQMSYTFLSMLLFYTITDELPTYNYISPIQCIITFHQFSILSLISATSLWSARSLMPPSLSPLVMKKLSPSTYPLYR